MDTKLDNVQDERLFLAVTDVPEVFYPPVRHDGAQSAQSIRQVAATFRALAQRVPEAMAAAIAKENAYGTAFLVAPLFVGTGAIAYFAAGYEPSWVSLVSCLLILIALRLTFSNARALAVILNAATLTAVGAVAGKVETARHQQIMLGEALSTTVEGVVRYAERSSSGLRLEMDVVSTKDPVLKFAPTGARVSVRGKQEQIRAGDYISARMHLTPPSGPVRPGGYDFAMQAWFDDIGATGYVTGTVMVDSQHRQLLPIERLERLRQAIAARIRTRLSGDEAEVSAALVAGVQGGISKDTAEAMRISGLSHILSISGLHMALVAGLFLYGLRYGFALVPMWAQKYPVKKIASVAALAACFFYLALSGAGVATLRSFIMIAVMLVAVMIDRPALTMRNLMIAALIILLVTPHEIMGPSFQMSFAATAALVAAYQAWGAWQRERRHLPERGIAARVSHATMTAMVATAATSAIAGLATALYAAWHFHRLAPFGLLANLLATIPVSLLIMPFGVLSVLLMPFGLDGWAIDVMGKGVGVMLAIARWVAEITPETASGAVSQSAFLIGSAGLCLLLLLQTRMRLIGLIPMAAAIIIQLQYQPADILASEDGKLVAISDGTDALAVNQRKPNQFTAGVWQKAAAATKLIPPQMAGAQNASQINGFQCEGILCHANLEQGARILWLGYPAETVQIGKHSLLDPETQAIPATDQADIAAFTALANRHCHEADLMIINGPTYGKPCSGQGVAIVTARDLARQGSLEIHVKPQADKAQTDNTGKRPVSSIAEAAVWSTQIRSRHRTKPTGHGIATGHLSPEPRATCRHLGNTFKTRNDHQKELQPEAANSSKVAEIRTGDQ